MLFRSVSENLDRKANRWLPRLRRSSSSHRSWPSHPSDGHRRDRRWTSVERGRATRSAQQVCGKAKGFASAQQCVGAAQAAEKRWPSARFLSSGSYPGVPGNYAIPDGRGHFADLRLKVELHLMRQTNFVLRARSSYCTRRVYGVTVNASLSSFLWGNQWLDTYNGVKYGDYAWNISATPGCSGAGSCQAPQQGVIGNYSSQAEPLGQQLST